METLGDRIKCFRKELKLTQTELADRAGLSQSYIAKREPPSRPDQEKTVRKLNPSLAVLQRLARALDVTIAELVEEPKRRSR